MFQIEQINALYSLSRLKNFPRQKSTVLFKERNSKLLITKHDGELTLSAVEERADEFLCNKGAFRVFGFSLTHSLNLRNEQTVKHKC
jgi:hypothetical protein